MSNDSGSELILVRKESSTCGGMGWLAWQQKGRLVRPGCARAATGPGSRSQSGCCVQHFLADFMELLNERQARDANPYASA
jgi:hypothetical protein